MDNLLKETATLTPDPDRALKNLERLVMRAPAFFDSDAGKVAATARLFAFSQFLAEYCINNPERLNEALAGIDRPISKEDVLESARQAAFMSDIAGSVLQPGEFSFGRAFKQDAMKFLRNIKRQYLLQITLRDLMGITSLTECMGELSELAEAIVELGLDISYAIVKERFGTLENNSYCVISLGKLGAEELNYSSDIDIMAVYDSGNGLSSGSVSLTGVATNRVTPHEYYCRLTETLSGLLNTQTEDGIAYRVDLRLRPNGRKGELALSTDAYVTYYESWGATWERMALIRARPVAGDIALGNKLIEAIEPFLWRRSSDFYEIEEIRELKKQIDTIFDVDDIKRGYGGIREIEFFIQTFQLLYGGERENLRTHRLPVAINELLKDKFLIEEDVETLSQSYTFLRRLEHVLQMRDDLQTHSLPKQADELEILARKLDYSCYRDFASELMLRRLMVHDMYNSLLGGDEKGEIERQHEAAVFLEDELNDNEVRDYLAFKGFKEPAAALQNVKLINEQVSFQKTIRARTLLRKTIPMFLEEIMGIENKDRALNMFARFIEKTAGFESYIDLFSKRPDVIKIIVKTFSESRYFTRLLLSLDNLESIFEYPDIRVDYIAVKERLATMLEHSRDPMSAVREFKTIEELRIGLLFLSGVLDIDGLSNKLSTQASMIVRTVLQHLGGDSGFAVIALGKFGSGEMNIGSDLDLIFVADNQKAERLAGELIKFLSEYTPRGIVYEIDMRLRPDGSKGILVNDIKGYRNYYMKKAQPWEVQALLRARPVAGDPKLLRAFHELKAEVIRERGPKVKASDIKDMRKRIIRELSRERGGFDLKLGPGGIEEIEFLVQYLQLKNSTKHRNLITHRTLTAIKRLFEYGIIDAAAKNQLSYAYDFLRTVDTIRRINEEAIVKPGSELADIIARFFEFGSRDDVASEIEATRAKVVKLTEVYYIN